MPLSRILVDIDAKASAHPALEQAAALAARCGARLTIVDVVPEVPPGVRLAAGAEIERLLVDELRARLDAVARSVAGLAVTTEVLRGRPATAVIEEVIRSGHDLLVRSHGRDLAATKRGFGAVDMELLRQCPCPVWLVTGAVVADSRRMLAAVHANPDDPTEQQLNGAILDLAVMLRDVTGAQLSILQAWSLFGESLLKSHMQPAELAGVVDDVHQRTTRALSDLVQTAGASLQGAALEVVKGEPEEVIPRFVEAHGIDLLVLGTAARTGIPGLLIGNTAERVLQRVRCSVVAVKPPGFESAVHVRAQGARGVR